MRVPLLLLLFAGVLAAQQPGVYRVSFSVEETEAGKTVSTKAYSLLVEEGNRGVLRLGSRVPVPSAGGSTQYVDVGLNLDCMPRQMQAGQLSMNTEVEISSVEAEQVRAGAPQIRQIRTSSRASVIPGRPTTIASLDDLTGKRHYEIQVTATPVK